MIGIFVSQKLWARGSIVKSRKESKGSLKSFLKSEDVLGGQTIDQYNQELDQAMERINRFEFTSLEELEREMKSW